MDEAVSPGGVGRRAVLVGGAAGLLTAAAAATRPGTAGAAPAAPAARPADGIWPARPRTFVTTRGTQLVLDGRRFRFGGTNNYYLHYKSHYMIDSVLNDAAAMGLTVIRCWGFVDGDGAGAGGVTLHPAPFEYDEDGFDALDYAVHKAGTLGIRLVVALTNNWPDFGGIPQYASWFGITHDEFFTNRDARAAYKAWVKHVLGRTNRYTGLRYDREPTVMTWELCNEPRCPSDKTGDTLVRWADEMSRYVKRLAPRQLVAVGDEGFYGRPGDPDYPYSDYEGVAWPRLTALPAVDYGTVHLYPQSWGNKTAEWATTWITDHIRDGHALGSPVVLEEFGWSLPGVGDEELAAVRDPIYTTWTAALEAADGDGSQFWILTGRQDDGTLYPNYDGYRVVYPSSTAAVLSAHARRMSGVAAR